MPQGVTERAFAKLDGCSHTAVQNGLKRGGLKAFDDGTIDPALAGTNWRSGNWRPRRGGKPTKLPPQLATLTPGVAILPAVPVSDRDHEIADRHLLIGLRFLGRHIPAIAVEAARHLELAPGQEEALFEAVRAAVEMRVHAELQDEMTVEHAEHLTGGALMPRDHYRRPGETEDAMWERIVLDEA